MGKNTRAKKAKVSVEEPAIAAPVVDTTTAGRFAALRVGLDAVRDTLRLTPDMAPATVATATAALVDAPAPVPNRCRFTGLPVAVAQNALFVMNETDGWHFSDDVLAVAWHLMFPANAAKIAGGAGFVSNVTKYIAGTRSLYNHHRHGALPPGMDFRPAQGRSAKAQKPTPAAPPVAATDSIQEPVAAAA